MRDLQLDDNPARSSRGASESSNGRNIAFSKGRQRRSRRTTKGENNCMLCRNSLRSICFLSFGMVLAVMTLAVMAWASTLRAEPAGGQSAALPSGVEAGLAAGAGFQEWIKTFWPDAEAAGVSRETFDKTFNNLSPDCAQTGVSCPGAAPDAASSTSSTDDGAGGNQGRTASHGAGAALPESCNKVSQKEFLRPAGYFPRSYIRELVVQGQTLLYKWRRLQPGVYASILNIQRSHGVNRHVLMALWARETSYGDSPDDHNAVRSLASLAYAGAPARRPWHRKQLVAALKMIEEGHVALKDFTSSYAGATGLTQIMPDEFLKYATDGDGDSRKDIWRSAPDSLATTANILEHNGWNKERRGWGYEVEGTRGRALDCTMEGKNQTRPIREWAFQYGLRRVKGRGRAHFVRHRKFPGRDLDTPAYLVAPAGARGPAFLVTQNFDVLKKYNPAELYALFIGYIADRLGCDGPGRRCEFARPWPDQTRDDFPFSVENLCRLQIGLRERGFLSGLPDGLFGPQTRVAIGHYQKANGQKADCYPNMDLFKAVTAPVVADSPTAGVRAQAH
jgi:lytic murein transglycosylase